MPLPNFLSLPPKAEFTLIVRIANTSVIITFEKRSRRRPTFNGTCKIYHHKDDKKALKYIFKSEVHIRILTREKPIKQSKLRISTPPRRDLGSVLKYSLVPFQLLPRENAPNPHRTAKRTTFVNQSFRSWSTSPNDFLRNSDILFSCWSRRFSTHAHLSVRTDMNFGLMYVWSINRCLRFFIKMCLSTKIDINLSTRCIC